MAFPLLISAVATGARLLWTASKFGTRAVVKNPVKTGLIGTGVVYQDEITDTYDEVTDKNNYIKVVGWATAGYLTYRWLK